MLNRITPLILTHNEAPNIARTLERLSWAGDIVVVDSGSNDGTRDIARNHRGVRVFERPFTTHDEQWNFGVAETGITTEWVLALDADFVLSHELIEELRGLQPPNDVAGYRASFTYCVGGTPLRSAVYPPVTVLFRRAAGHYEQDGHTQRVNVQGAVRPLQARILHDDRKSLGRWLSSQARYMALEADKLTAANGSLSLVDRARKLIVVAPAAMFVYCLLARGGILDGRRGLYYAMQRTAAEAILSLYLLERRLSGR
jgi:glycosyltransferase involved in cell wall biosynthesis